MIKRYRNAICYFCIFLVFNLQAYQVLAQAEPPTRFLQQIERLQDGDQSGVITNLQDNDEVMSFIDIAWPMFPLKVTKMIVQWQRPSYPVGYKFPVIVVPKLYESRPDGIYLDYIGVGAVLQPDGMVEIPLEQMWSYYPDPSNSQLKAPIFGVPQLQQWIGIYAGIVIMGGAYGPMDSTYASIGCVTDGAWDGYNMMCREGIWDDMLYQNLPGDLCIRLEVEPLCPAKLGDLDWDGDIDEHDQQIMQSSIAYGGDIFNDWRILMDLNNDMLLDAQDMAILDAHFTGEGIPTACPFAAAVGDVNCDGLINNGDIDAFIMVLTSLDDYNWFYAGCDISNSDINRDGLVNNGDIDSFIELLTPATLALNSNIGPPQIPLGADRIPARVTSKTATPTTFDRSVIQPRTAPDLQVEKQNVKNSAMLIVAAVFAVVGVVTLVWLLWHLFDDGGFMANSRNPRPGTEIERIQASIDMLNQQNNDDSHDAFMVLGSVGFYNSEITGYITVNYQPVQDVSDLAKVWPQMNRIVIHESLVNPPNGEWTWNDQRILTAALFGEWEHIQEPLRSEKECEIWLERWLQEVGWQDLQLPFHHGVNEDRGD